VTNSDKDILLPRAPRKHEGKIGREYGCSNSDEIPDQFNGSSHEPYLFYLSRIYIRCCLCLDIKSVLVLLVAPNMDSVMKPFHMLYPGIFAIINSKYLSRTKHATIKKEYSTNQNTPSNVLSKANAISNSDQTIFLDCIPN